jgi:hypothetical protein
MSDHKNFDNFDNSDYYSYNDYYDQYNNDYSNSNFSQNHNKKIKNTYNEIIEFEEDIMDTDFEFTRTDENDLNINESSDLFYPTIPDFDYWELFLNRKLKEKEQRIIHDYLLENDINSQIKSLHFNLVLNGTFTIPKLTKNNGNCLFESLSYLGYGKSSEIRKNIAALLLSVKNNYDFFPNKNICPEEMFTNCNDVELVKDEISNKVYEYDFDAMVVDLYSNHSWARLPMELILMTISRIFEINIKIFSNKSEYINTVSVWDASDDIETVYLGHLNEEHYVPVIKISEDITKDSFLMDEFTKCYPIYTSAKKNYHKWGKNMAMNLGLYGNNIQNTSTDTNSYDYSSLAGTPQLQTQNTNSNFIDNSELLFDLDEIKDIGDFQIIK